MNTDFLIYIFILLVAFLLLTLDFVVQSFKHKDKSTFWAAAYAFLFWNSAFRNWLYLKLKNKPIPAVSMVGDINAKEIVEKYKDITKNSEYALFIWDSPATGEKEKGIYKFSNEIEGSTGKLKDGDFVIIDSILPPLVSSIEKIK